jgi:antitoxin (DNA-binding transcriptional repressor) of toxin-antitoxin stability system
MTVELQEFGTKFVELAESAAGGEEVIFVREGKPYAKLIQLPQLSSSFPEIPIKRLGFLEGECSVPEDFDTMFDKEIGKMFYGSSLA